MENNNWEKEFSKLAMDAEVSPPEHIWTNIEQSMDKAKKGRRMFPGIFLGGVILAMFIFTFAFRDTLFSNMMSHADNKDTNEMENSSSANKLADSQSTEAELNAQNGKIESEIPSSDLGSDYFSINNNAAYSISEKSLNTISIEKSTISPEKSTNELNSKNSKNDKLPTSSLAGSINTDQKYNISGSQKVKTSYLNSNRTTRTSKFEGNISTLAASEFSTANMINLATKEFSVINSNMNLLGMTPCTNFKLPRKPKFYADIEAGLGYSSKIINPKSVEATEYMGIRNQSERVWYNAGGAVHFGSLWSNISLDIGLEYMQINEVFTGNKENETRITINIIEDGMGNVIGRDTVAEVGSRQMVSRNTYRQYVLPVRFGYFQSIEKISMGVNFGAAYAFSTQMEGVIFDTDGTYYDINTDEKEYFNTDGYWKIIAGVYLGYRTGKNMEIYLRPQISLDQRSMDRISSPVSQKFSNIQVFGGVRYFFY